MGKTFVGRNIKFLEYQFQLTRLHKSVDKGGCKVGIESKFKSVFVQKSCSNSKFFRQSSSNFGTTKLGVIFKIQNIF